MHEPDPLQVSLPLQTFPSLHDVPLAAGACWIPLAGSQESIVHGLPSSRFGGLPATQLPAPSQVSLPLHTLPSEHVAPAAAGVCLTPDAGSQLSLVHGLPSSNEGAVPG